MKLTPLERWIMNKTGIKNRDRKSLEEYQLSKIIETVKYAKKNSRFYSDRFNHIYEDDIQSLKDFEKIPFTTARQIRENPLSFLCVSQRDIKRIVTLNTSGTSGEEKRIYFTGDDLDYTIDFFKHGMSCLTDKMDRVLVLLPGSSYGSIGDLLKKALAMSGTECFVQGVLTDPKETAKYIDEKKITCIVGIPLQVLYLSRTQSSTFRNNIKKVLLSTDYVPEILINELQNKFDCKVFNHYGMTEMGYGGGVECEALKGYHMREADLYFEIINPHTGELVQDGQYGEVVFTTLTRQAMPLIRYRTGDTASFSANTCACGTFLKTMTKVLGRIDNKVILNNNQNIYLRELDEIVLSCEGVMDYKAYMEENDVLFIETAVNSNTEFNVVKEKIICSLQQALHNKLGYRIDIEVVLRHDNKPEKITNSMIKRRIYDFRNGG